MITTIIHLYINLKKVIHMIKRLRTIAIVAFGTVACMVAFSSCAEDQDDFFKKHRQDIAERDKEDAAIRQDLQTEIKTLEQEITHKIDSVENVLYTLLENQEKGVLSDLQTKGNTMRSNINTRYGQFITFMEGKYSDEENAINSLFGKMDGLKTTLTTTLASAIATNNGEQQKKVQALLDDINGSESLINAGKQKMNDLMNSYKDITDQAAKLLELENRLQKADENITTMLQNLPQTMQTYKEQVLAATDTQLGQLSNSELTNYQSRLRTANERYEMMLTYLSKLGEYQSRIEDITDKYQQLANDAGDLEDIYNDVDDAWSKYDDAADIIDRINNLDISEYESLPDNYLTDLDAAMDDLKDAESTMNGYENDLKDAYDMIQDEYGLVEDNFRSLEDCLHDMHDEFDAIPFS